jgi:broad specificity phosphatase PhoE
LTRTERVLAPVLYFVRHGETDWNREARLQGQRDVPLNAVGRAQAEAAGQRLAALVPNAVALPYIASPLGRTRETMELLRGAIGLPPSAYDLDDRLKELTFGRWEGMTWREVRARDAAAATRRERDKWGFVPPDGESYAMLAARIAPMLAGLDSDTVLVSHGGVARVVLALRGLASEQVAPRLDIWQGKVLVVASDGYRWA